MNSSETGLGQKPNRHTALADADIAPSTATAATNAATNVAIRKRRYFEIPSTAAPFGLAPGLLATRAPPSSPSTPPRVNCIGLDALSRRHKTRVSPRATS